MSSSVRKPTKTISFVYARCDWSVILTMDIEMIESMFRNNSNVMKSFVEILFDKLQKEIREVKEENADLKRSLEFTQAELASVQKKEHGASIPRDFSELHERVRILEDRSKSKNLRITGLNELHNENMEQTTHAVQKLVAEKLGQQNVRVKTAFRIGKQNGSSSSREIVAHLSSEQDKTACLKSGRKLKGSNVYVNDDVSYATLQIRKAKLPELKRKREEGLIAYFSGAQIITRQKTLLPPHQRPPHNVNQNESSSSVSGNSNRSLLNPPTSDISTESSTSGGVTASSSSGTVVNARRTRNRANK